MNCRKGYIEIRIYGSERVEIDTGAYGLVVMTSPSHGIRSLGEKDVLEYLDIAELSGITEGHKKEIHRSLNKYMDYTKWTFDKNKSLEYFRLLLNNYSIAYYKKQMYQIRKYLLYKDKKWIEDIRLPSDPHYFPKRIGIKELKNTIDYFFNGALGIEYNAWILSKDDKTYLPEKQVINGATRKLSGTGSLDKVCLMGYTSWSDSEGYCWFDSILPLLTGERP